MSSNSFSTEEPFLNAAERASELHNGTNVAIVSKASVENGISCVFERLRPLQNNPLYFRFVSCRPCSRQKNRMSSLLEIGGTCVCSFDQSLQVLLCFFFFFSSLAITHKEARALSSSFSSSSSFISLAHSPTHTHSQTHPYSHTHIHSFSFQLFHTSSHNFEMLQDRNFSSYLTTSPNFTLNVKAAPIEDFGKNITSSKCKWENTSGSFKCEKNTKWSSHFKMSCNNNILARPNFKVTMQLKFSKQLDFQLQWIKNNSSEQEMFHF